jgi:hypothetical protein
MATDLGEVVKHRKSIIYILLRNPGLICQLQALVSKFIILERAFSRDFGDNHDLGNSKPKAILIKSLPKRKP